MLVLQLAWTVAVPPFRGIDEFDHVYKAASVARGDWFPTPTDATRGTGAWLEVPTDLVQAAQPRCKALVYTKDADCVGTPHGDTTRIASGAGRYNPVYYAVVGTPALPFDGNTAVYVMRLSSILLCWLLFWLALTATRIWARTPWPTTAIAIASTPMLVYSSSIVAPNGVEMMSGLALWSAALGLTRDPPRRDQTRLLLTAMVAGSILVTTRSLGPLLCLLILITVIAATRPPRGLVSGLFTRRLAWVTAVVVFAATVLSTVYIVAMEALDVAQQLGKHISFAKRLSNLIRAAVMWFFQGIAAFPLRDEPTKPAVYACYAVLFIVLFVLGMRYAARGLRAGIVLALVASTAVPFGFGLDPTNAPGFWQGRYMLAYSVGIAILIGFALDQTRHRLKSIDAFVGLGLFVVAQTIGPVDVFRRTVDRSMVDYHDVLHPSAVVVAALAVMGSAAMWWGATRAPSQRADHGPS
jgi:hypothetical protein